MGKKVKKESEPPSKDVFDPLPIESKKAATVVLMLNSPEEEVLVKACEAIHKFAEKGDENRSSLLGLGAVEPLSHLISHEDKLVRRNAFMALGVMAANSDVKRLLKKLDAIPSIIGKLSPEEDVVVHEFATLCLASLSVDFSCKVQISDQEGLEPLIQLLSSPDPDVKKNSVETICNLVQDLPSRVAVRELNGVPPLLELLRSEFPVIQQLSLRTLVIVTTDTDTRATFREEQGFDRLLEFLCNKEFSDLHVEALQVLSNCLEDRDSLQLIHETGGLQRLLQFITTPTLLDIQTNAVKAIYRVAQSSENRKLLHEQDIERSLVELLSLEGDSLRTATCQAVAAMSLHLASKDAFRDLDGIRAVVQLLGSEGGEVREAAAQALSSLTSSNQLNAYAVYEAEGDEGLVQQLHDVIPGAVAHAAAVLTNMAEQEVLRCSILSHGAMAALLEPLKSADTHTLVRATQALAALACDAEGRADLRNAGGLVPLVQLLQSNHKEVRRNACWAISVCANDEPTAVEMCKLGALDLLQEINSSANRRNKFSEIALQRLLDSNLSLKYSLTNTLAPTDITMDGFYDPGKVELCFTSFSALTPFSCSLSLCHFGLRALLAWETYVRIARAREVDNKQKGQVKCLSLFPFSFTLSSCSKGKSKGRKEDEKLRDEDESKAQQEVATVTEKPWMLPYDAAFHALVTEATKTILPLHAESEQYSALARLVSEVMGGAVEVDRQHDFLWELHLSELRYELQSNIIPIGQIRKGTYYHRALLYKVLADRIGVSCSLVRGEYNRVWNEVLLSAGTPHYPGCQPQPRAHLVDLIHQPGRLLRANTPQAIQYQTI
uniref:Armadillo repeat containing 3 n=1 Tax=Salmo trutta TaxID=8032 RepID=A0A674BDU6_SALTR